MANNKEVIIARATDAEKKKNKVEKMNQKQSQKITFYTIKL